jgi:hypothetical protein
MSIGFDPARLDIRNSSAPLTGPVRKRLPKPRNRDWFFHSRIPGTWLAAASRLNIRALRVALAVWHEAAMRKSAIVTLPAKVLERFSIVRVDPGLAELERAGLVSTKRHRGRRPEITIEEARE